MVITVKKSTGYEINKEYSFHIWFPLKVSNEDKYFAEEVAYFNYTLVGLHSQDDNELWLLPGHWLNSSISNTVMVLVVLGYIVFLV